MRRPLGLGGVAVFATILACTASAQGRVNKTLDVRLDPTTSTITVTADVTPAGETRDVEFLLHSRLRITKAAPAVREGALGNVSWRGDVEGAEIGSAPAVKRYRVTLPAAGASFRVEYRGVFDFAL